MAAGTTLAKPAEPTKSGSYFAGWYTDAAATESLYTFSKKVTADFTLYAAWSTEKLEEVNDYIQKGITYLLNKQFSEGLNMFELAYRKDPTDDKAKLYSGLTQLAMISMSDEVKTLIRDHFGMTSYPGSINALLSDSWFDTAYEDVHTVWIDEYEISATSLWSGYVRVAGRVVDTADGDVPCASVYVKSPNNTDMFINSYYYSYYYDTSFYSKYLTDIQQSDTGNYLLPVSVDPNDGSKYYNDDLGIDKPFDAKNVVCTNYCDSYKIKASNGSNYPGFTLPEWLENSEVYTNSLFKGLKTTETLSILMLANIVDLNTDGFNGLVDDLIAGVFGPTFTEACSRINSMTAAVDIPADLIGALRAEGILGTDETVKVGKDEATAIIASLKLFKGALQWLQSYNLNYDLSWTKKAFTDPASFEFDSSIDPFVQNVLSARPNGSAFMNAANATFTEALTEILTSYSNITADTNGNYPEAFKNEMEKYCDKYAEMVATVLNAIENKTKCSLGAISIDFGKFFTPGYFALTNFLTGSNGTPEFYVYVYDGYQDAFYKLTVANYKTISNSAWSYVSLAVDTSIITDVVSGVFPFDSYEYIKLVGLDDFIKSDAAVYYLK
ncbi:cell wall/surface repeat protein [Treponema brennaborense DSM 12168]|uniref:Cell wall/surface repeat protein n=1 Tax=Treponema brennaborense (strain DSM 12168 / CIP 105900 / DD5/3) TaxID=906968 RepID=F4LLJ8_TREBD|nr:cell wall/surface repeat protein [Treponema brennaborense DSM 12168]